jgi:hypothetical protein
MLDPEDYTPIQQGSGPTITIIREDPAGEEARLQAQIVRDAGRRSAEKIEARLKEGEPAMPPVRKPKPGEAFARRNEDPYEGVANTTQPSPSRDDPKPGTLGELKKWVEARSAYGFDLGESADPDSAMPAWVLLTFSGKWRAEGMLINDEGHWRFRSISCESSEEGRKCVKDMVGLGLLPETCPVKERRGGDKPDRVWLRWSGGFTCADEPADLTALERFFAAGHAGDAIITSVPSDQFDRITDYAGANTEAGSIYRRGLDAWYEDLRGRTLVWLTACDWAPTGARYEPAEGLLDYVRAELPDHELLKRGTHYQCDDPAEPPTGSLSVSSGRPVSAPS